LGKEKPISTSSLVPAAVFALLTLGYFVWFFPQPAARLSLLAELGDPFAFIAQWFGPAGTPLGLLDRVPVLAMAGAIFLAAYGIGSPVVTQLGPAVPGGREAAKDAHSPGTSNRNDWTTFWPLERFVFSLAAGLSLLSTLVLLIGLAGLLPQAWLLWLIVMASAGSGIWQMVRDHWSRQCTWRDHWSRLGDRSALRTPSSARAWIAIAFVAILLLGSLLPPWDFDVREYHLQVPKEWRQQGQITFLPHNVYGNMPLAAEMPALLAMGLWPGEHGWFYGALAGKVVIAAFAALTAVGVACAGQRIAGKPGGILAAVVFLSHPWVIQVAINGLNDGVLACYVFLALYAMCLARRGECSYLLPGLLAGAAAAVKYPGLAFAVAPVAVWALFPRSGPLVSRENGSAGASPSRSLALTLVATGILLGGGGWYAKNAFLTGNPVYPLAYGVFGGTTRTAEKAAQWDKAHQVPRDKDGWRYSAGQLAGSALRVAGRDPLASPLVVPMIIAAILALVTILRSNPSDTPHSAFRIPHLIWPMLAALLWILAVWWFLSHRLDRFLLPVWPLVAVIASVAALPEDRWWRRTMTAVVWIGLAYCYLAASSTLVGDNRWFVSLEQLRRDQPWPQHTPQRVKLSHRWLNEQSSPHAPREGISRSEMATLAVLLVGDAEPFELEMPVFYNTCFDDSLLCNWMLNKTPSERHQELASRNIAWVVVDWPWIDRYQSPGNYGFDPRFKPKLLDELVQQGGARSAGEVGRGI
jgi:hypothetical protein